MRTSIAGLVVLLFLFKLIDGTSVDPSSLDGKVMFGYQGWFGADGDGLSGYGYRHWSRSGQPGPGNLAFDSFPNFSEYPAECLFPSALTYSSGSKVKVYSCYCPGVVDLHFQWLRDYNLDGVFLQRFVSEIQTNGVTKDQRDKITSYVKSSAEKYGRVFGIMYDVSGANSNTLFDVLKADWAHLINDLKVTTSPNYIHQSGKPVLVIWGFGFTSHPPDTTTQAIDIINYFKNTANVYLVGGVPFYWLDSIRDSKPNYLPVYQTFNALSPWAVGRYNDNSTYDYLFQNIVLRDKDYTTKNKVGYAPVIWPGFSWSNLQSNPSLLNAIPRRGGQFFTHQAEKVLSLQPSWIYLAMFDEVNEGTAFFKLASTKAETPTNANFTYQSIDGTHLPSDGFLLLAEGLTKTFKQKDKL